VVESPQNVTYCGREVIMTQEERQALLEACEGIRVADLHDAMDTLGLFDRGLMEPGIGPLWRDIENFSHRIIGFAFTVRYVPSSRTIVPTDAEDFRRQEGEWYRREPDWAAELQAGDVVVIDGTNTKDTGYIGSMNSLSFLSRGAVGIVTNSGVRDTDELIKEKVPVYCKGVTRGICPGRTELDSFQKPVECGGVYVHPGDLVVADGDGVMVIPIDKVQDVLDIAREILRNDQKARARLYKDLGIPPDFTLGDAAADV